MAQIAAERSEAPAVATANPAPLGLCAFALTTFVLSAANAGWFTGPTIVIGLAFFYGGLAQMLAGMWEFRAGNTFGATAFTSYGAFWIAVGATLQWKLIPNGTAFGFFLLGWTIFTGLMFLGTLRSNGALIAVFGLLFLTYLFLAIGALGNSTSMNTIGGYLGILTALAAWYTALAGILTSGRSAFTLPTWPIG
ncbi:MAG TPA: acetate uptake transporter [Ktedonobacteraceae bacterium]|nr:acetate uptake transporter [Ktedonobacteraceae bacterium]